MKDNTRKKLIDRGAEALADALISLASQDKLAADVVERLSSDQQELIKKVKRKISGLKRRKAFIHWRESGKFADHIDAILVDIRAAEPDPEAGLRLLAAFFETDKAVFNNCDDSSGHISVHYKVIAPNMFAMYGSDCADKKMVLDLLIKLYSDDDFSVREGLIEKTYEMIGLHETLNAIHLFEILEEQEEDEYQKYRYQYAILSLARQTYMPQLFERTTLKRQPQPGAAAILAIAEVYLASGEPGIANEWVEKISEGDVYMADKRDNLLLLIYKALGNPEKLEKTAWKKFRAMRSMDTLKMLLEVIGEDKREQIIEDEACYIIDEEIEANYNDIQFLIDAKQIDEAEICILVKAGTGKLDGYLYPILLPIAKAMEKEERLLAAYVIYRELMLSILDRKFYKGYPHAAKYLRKLNTLSEKIEDWQDLGNHLKFLTWLEDVHGKKSSFWRHYHG